MEPPLPPDDAAPLADYLQAGIEAADLPPLFPLLRARTSLEAFVTLFRGSWDGVVARLLVLREIGARGEAPRWSTRELHAHFAYLDPVKLETILARLRDNRLLLWEAEEATYQVSPAGRMALAALTTLLGFSNEEEGELGFITAQVAASGAMGRLSAEELQHLLSRLNELQGEFDRAVLSGSEHRIRAASLRLESVWRWVEKGTAVMRRIAADGDLDPPTHRVAQAIGRAQSRMLRMAAVFERTLGQLERQRVHLGESGLSSSDILTWLRGQPAASLVALIDGAVAAGVEPCFLLADVAVDVAEYELVDREREAEQRFTLPPPVDPVGAEEVTAPALDPLARWLPALAAIDTPTPLAEAIPGADYRESAYRFSILPLLGDGTADGTAGDPDGPMASLHRLPLAVALTGESVTVQRGEIAEMSDGTLVPTPSAETVDREE